jgi:GPI mannosyltransferase 3
VLLFLIGSRLLNALIIQTFFQPDEYFQALEPAWALAFGPQSGAWITWVSSFRTHTRY